MKRNLLILALLLSTALPLAAQEAFIFDAMQDEIRRTMLSLKQDKLAKPYYLSYGVFDINTYQVSAELGSITKKVQEQFVNTDIMMRVGNKKEDNSYFEHNVINTAAMQWPARGYDALRFALWQGTDQVYKDSLSQLAKKQAYKKSKNVTEDYEDFSPSGTASIIEMPNPPVIDDAYWQATAQLTSAQGKINQIESFETSINIVNNPFYFLSSEGAKYFKDDTLITITFYAKTRAQDGFELKLNNKLNYADMNDIPPQQELIEKAQAFAQEIAALSQSPKVEPYIGPVLLEKGAAASLFNSMFKRNITNTRPILSSTYDKDASAGEFAQKKGLKVMPVNFNVIDDPLLKTFAGQTLAGYYAVDDEGVPAQKLSLVKNGKLMDLPTTRSLIKNQYRSNGHARAGYGNREVFARAGVGNLFFLPHNTTPKPDFKAQFIEYCKEEGMEYCYIIKEGLTSGILPVYKVDVATGAETLLHGAATPELTTRTLRDIKFAADDLAPYNYLGFNGYSYTIVAPSVILSELEIKPTQKAAVRQPLVKRP